MAGLSLYGIAAMTKEVVEAGDAINDMSQKLGIGTEQLGALQYAAEQLGSSTNALNTGLQFLNKNIGLLQQGSTAAVEAFGRLGLKADSLVGLTLDQKFLLVAESIKRLGSDTEQAASAQQIFGKGGQELLPIIRAGTSEIIRMGDAAAATGSLFNESQAEGMNNAADAIKNLAASYRGLRIELVESFAPAMAWIADMLAKATRLFRAAQLGIEEMIIESMGDAGSDISVERANLKKRKEAVFGGDGSGPLSAPSKGGLVPVRIVKDDTQSGDVVTLGTAGIR